MIAEINEEIFLMIFEKSERSEHFSNAGLLALYHYLEEAYSEENIFHLDVVGLCSYYTEFKNLNDYLKIYPHKSLIEDLKSQFKNLIKSEENFSYIDTEEDFNSWLNYNFSEWFEKRIKEKTTLIKIGEDLEEGFIIENYTE